MNEQGILRILAALGVSRSRKSGSRITAPCPLAPFRHANGVDRNPSFSIEINSVGPSQFKCFACGISGKKTLSLLYAWKEATGNWLTDLHGFIRDQEGGSPREQLDRFGGYRSRQTSRDHGESAWNAAGYERKFAPADVEEWMGQVPRYVLDRGVTVEQAKRWELGFDRDRQRLVIPLRDEHRRLVGYSKRAIHDEDVPKYLHAKGMARDQYLYGEHMIDRSCRTGILIEGFFDVWAFDRRGYRNALGSMGTAVSATHILKMRKWFDRVIVFPHNDPKPDPTPLDEAGAEAPELQRRDPPLPPGLKMARDYCAALVTAGVKAGVAPVVDGRKDPGDWQEADWLLIEAHDRLRPVLHELKRRSEGCEETRTT